MRPRCILLRRLPLTLLSHYATLGSWPRKQSLSHQEAIDLVLSILDGVEAIEAGEQPRESWAPETRTWMELILDRKEGEGA